MTLDDLPTEVRESYPEIRVLPDGRIIGIHRLLFHWTMHVGIDPVGYAERYCFADRSLAEAAIRSWDGTGDPEGWHRHSPSERRRNLATGEEWISS